jgi:hypothetical protein
MIEIFIGDVQVVFDKGVLGAFFLWVPIAKD